MQYLNVIAQVNTLLWDYFLIYFIIASAVFFTYYLDGVQLKNFKLALRLMFASKKHGESQGISPFQALCTSLASRVGTGNIAGVAIAITLGGPGAVFWMWLLALLGMATAFVESALAQLYKTHSLNDNKQENIYRGGPAYYMAIGMKSPILSIAFAISMVLTYAYAFNSAQSHTIAQAFLHSCSVPPLYSGAFMCIITGMVILGGIKRIASFSEMVVPFMSIAYIIVTTIIIALNYHLIPSVIANIFLSAFGLQEAAGGVVGYSMTSAMLYGGKRGLFSNEAGMGSAPNIAAAAGGSHPAIQGYVQMLGPFFDTIIICSCTAFIILFSQDIVPTGISGVELTQQAIVSQVGAWGAHFVTFILFWFVFTTLLGNYSYAEMGITYLVPTISPTGLLIFRLSVLLIIAIAPLQSMENIWNTADVTMGVMTLLNLIALIVLRKEAVLILKDYHKHQVFNVNRYPNIASKINTKIW